MAGELGKASLDLEANLSEFRRNMQEGKQSAGGMENSLEALAAVARIVEKELGDVRLKSGQAAESNAIADRIEGSLGRIGRTAMESQQHLQEVKLSQTQATESEVAGDRIDRNLKKINRDANETSRALTRVRLSGVGVGPFGSGFGRVGVLGTAIGVGALAAPAAAPGALGLVGGLAAGAPLAAGAIGTLVLALQGVGKAVGGDKKAFDDLQPSQKEFVLLIRSMTGWLDKLKQIAGENLFKGVSEGLKSALSVGTVKEITKAVVEFSKAIGDAAAQWGRYFGSAQFQRIFGPVMAAAARNLGVISTMFLHLFDALGVVLRAGIPFTNWLVDIAAKGAKFLDTWVRAKESSGALAKGFDEARNSLRLVGSVLASFLRVVVALGRALYPVSQIFLKSMADGMNALASAINRNRPLIEGLATALVRGLVGAVKLAALGIKTLVDGLRAIGGDKAVIIAAVTAIGAAIALSLGPTSAAIVGAIVAVGLIRQHWGAIRDFMDTLAKEIHNSFVWLWDMLRIGAIRGALDVVEPFSHLPGFLGGWARKAKDNMQAELDSIHPPDMDWSAAAAQAGVNTGHNWAVGFANQVNAAMAQLQTRVLGVTGAFQKPDYKIKPLASKTEANPLGSGASYVPGYEPIEIPDPNVFGTPPPFDKNLGPKGPTPSVVPLSAQHALSLASENANKARQLHNKGRTAKRYLQNELGDLGAAEKIILAKYGKTSGKVHEQLFAALTRVRNQERTVRKQISEALKKSRGEWLEFAVTQAKNALAAAAEGSPAFNHAVAAERKALLAEIAYYHARARNDDLSQKERDAAAKKELAARNQLSKLRDVQKSALENRLTFAVEVAKLAVEKAEEGSAAWKKAIAAEVKALKAEIAFYDRIATNAKLSLDVRRQAIEAEISARQELKALTGESTASAAGGNIKQFVSTYTAIVGAYAPNSGSFPQPPAANPKTDTHLYDAVHSLRHIEGYLRQLVAKDKFPASHYAGESALAAAG